MDHSFPIGVDLTRDPVVTKVEGGEMREWPGCRIFVPEPLGDLGPDEAEPNRAEGLHGSNQDPVDAFLADLWPRLERCMTAESLGRVILEAGVPRHLKRAVGLAARDRLGLPLSDRTVFAFLKPGAHTEEARRRRHDKSVEQWRAQVVARGDDPSIILHRGFGGGANRHASPVVLRDEYPVAIQQQGSRGEPVAAASQPETPSESVSAAPRNQAPVPVAVQKPVAVLGQAEGQTRAHMDAYDWTWRHKYLDRPRRDRWTAFDEAKAEGYDFDAEDMMDALGLDAEAFAQLFDHMPAAERLPAARIEARRRGLPISAPALLEAFSGRRW